MKELYMQAHEELVEELLEENPDMDEDRAYDITADAAWERMVDKLSSIADSRPDTRR